MEVCSTSYKADYKLIPKNEEATYCQSNKSFQAEERILPRTIEFPPLLRELIIRDKIAKGETVKEVPKLNLKYKMGRENHGRIAKEDEKSNVQINCGLGTPVSPNLYKGINL